MISKNFIVLWRRWEALREKIWLRRSIRRIMKDTPFSSHHFFERFLGR